MGTEIYYQRKQQIKQSLNSGDVLLQSAKSVYRIRHLETALSLSVAMLSFCLSSCPAETSIWNICHLPDIGQESLRLELSDFILTATAAGSSVKETEAEVTQHSQDS